MKSLQYITLACFGLLMAFPAFAQDVIYKRDGQKQEGEIIEIKDNEIVFRKAGFPDGPKYVLKKSDVLMITTEDGSFEIINAEPVKYERTPRKGDLSADLPIFQEDIRRNIVSLDFFQLVAGNIGVNYERLFPSGQIGLYVPITYSFSSQTEWTNNYTYYAGLGGNFYPKGQGRFRYFTGLEVGLGENVRSECTFEETIEFGIIRMEEKCVDFVNNTLTVSMSNGFRYQLTEWVNFGSRLVIGAENGLNSGFSRSRFRWMGTMSFRF